MARTYTLHPTPAYKISKSALNMLTVQYALDLEEEGFIFITISPGVSEHQKLCMFEIRCLNLVLQWLATDMAEVFKMEADLSAATGAKAVLEAVQQCDKNDNGKFCNIRVNGWENEGHRNQYDGLSPPW